MRQSLRLSSPRSSRSRRRARTSSGLLTARGNRGDALYVLAAGRGLSLELEDVTGILRLVPEIASRFQIPEADWLAAFAARPALPGTLFLIGDGSSKDLPVRITHQERRVRHETSLTATVSPRSVDVIERVAVSVRHGTVNALDIRVPAEFADRWELLERQEVDIQERLREPDGSTHYRLTFGAGRSSSSRRSGFAIVLLSFRPLVPRRPRGDDPGNHDRGRRSWPGQGFAGSCARSSWKVPRRAGFARWTTCALSRLCLGRTFRLPNPACATARATFHSRLARLKRSRCPTWSFRVS